MQTMQEKAAITQDSAFTGLVPSAHPAVPEHGGPEKTLELRKL